MLVCFSLASLWCFTPQRQERRKILDRWVQPRYLSISHLLLGGKMSHLCPLSTSTFQCSQQDHSVTSQLAMMRASSSLHRCPLWIKLIRSKNLALCSCGSLLSNSSFLNMRLKVIISKWKTWWNHFDYAHSHGLKQLEFALWRKSMMDSKCWWKGIYRSSAAERRSEYLSVNCFSRLFAELNRPIDLFENFTKKNKFKSENKGDLQSFETLTANVLSWLGPEWTEH